MSATPLLFHEGDSLLIGDAAGVRGLWGVLGRKRGGYLLRPWAGGDPTTWSDDQISDAYCERRIIHYPFDVKGIPRSFSEVVNKVWEYWPPKVRYDAQRRLVYVQMVDAIRHEHLDMIEACQAAADAVFRKHKAEWAKQEVELAVEMAELAPIRRRRNARSDCPAHSLPRELTQPSPHTVRSWYLPWSKYGRDVRLLIPHDHLKGNRRPRRRVEPGDKPDAYKLMDVALQRFYMTMPRRSKKFAYKKYLDLCILNAIEPFSSRSFRNRIQNEYTDRQEFERRYGRKAAFLKFGIFERTELPERPLEEVEVDHCLIDLIVVHPVTGRPLGRPWLTVIIDRATRMILGVHLSFEVPSYASLQRALAHAFWPKDVSGIPDLCDDWPCHGVPEWLICDNGREFRSRSLRTSEALLQFNVVNLPVKMPWLKGAVERLFGTIGVQVFSLLEGATLSRTPDFYEPVDRARETLEGVRQMLIKWIVNDYHRTEHGTLRCTPVEKWRQLTDIYPVRPVPAFDHITRLTGEVVSRNISNVGIPYEGLLYSNKEVLENLLARRGGSSRDWLIRVDPYDLGEAWLLDDETGDWLVIPCTNQAISRGVSRLQHKMHRLTASKNLPQGQRISESDLATAKGQCEAAVISLYGQGRKTSTMAKAARYAANGEYFTPLHGAPIPQIPATISSAPTLPLKRELSERSPEPIPIQDLSLEVEALALSWVQGAKP